jgi:hypothetical protein
MSSNTRATDQLLGSPQAEEGKGIVRMEDRVDARAADVWSALTDPDRLASWLGEVEGNLRLGGEFRARFFASGWEGTGRVEVCEAQRQLLVRREHPCPGVRAWLPRLAGRNPRAPQSLRRLRVWDALDQVWSVKRFRNRCRLCFVGGSGASLDPGDRHVAETRALSERSLREARRAPRFSEAGADVAVIRCARIGPRHRQHLRCPRGWRRRAG